MKNSLKSTLNNDVTEKKNIDNVDDNVNEPKIDMSQPNLSYVNNNNYLIKSTKI